MSVFIVTWNINGAGASYAAKRQAFLDNLNRYANVGDSNLETVRWVSSNATAQAVSDDLRTKLDDNDRLFVSKVNAGQRAGWLNKDIWPWISARE